MWKNLINAAFRLLSKYSMLKTDQFSNIMFFQNKGLKLVLSSEKSYFQYCFVLVLNCSTNWAMKNYFS